MPASGIGISRWFGGPLIAVDLSTDEAERIPEFTRLLIEAGAHFYQRGWLVGNTGNLSAVISYDPLRLLITSGGSHKGALTAEELVLVDDSGAALTCGARPSADTALHLAIARQCQAGAVVHTHSVWSTLLSEKAASRGGQLLTGYELLKGLSGVLSHEHREWVPVIENASDYRKVTEALTRSLTAHPNGHAVLLRRHGLYTWGRDVAEAIQHAEIFEFLFEVVGRMG